MNSTAGGGLVILESDIADCRTAGDNIKSASNTILSGSTISATIGYRNAIQDGSFIRIASGHHMDGILGTISGRTNPTT